MQWAWMQGEERCGRVARKRRSRFRIISEKRSLRRIGLLRSVREKCAIEVRLLRGRYLGITMVSGDQAAAEFIARCLNLALGFRLRGPHDNAHAVGTNNRA